MYKMSLVTLVTLSMLVVMASSQAPEKFYDVAEAPNLFEKFIKDFNREYKDDADRELHYQAFCKNLGKINEMNKKSTTATFGINKFADYTEEEHQSMRGFKRPDAKKE